MGPNIPFYSAGHSDIMKMAFCIVGVMSTLLLYGVLQEQIMKSPYGQEEYFKYSLFIVLCNRVLTSAMAALFMLGTRKDITPVAPVLKYGAVSLSNVLSTTCQYEALKHVSFPVQTLGKCAKMLPVMVWGTFIMKKKYNREDYLVAALVTAGCAVFFLNTSSLPSKRYSENSNLWGIALMTGYLGFDGFTSTFQDKLFKGYNMDIFNQILYTTLCSGLLSIIGLLIQGQFLLAIDFMVRHPKCLYDILLLSCAATASQFFISYTIRSFGALFLATVMTTRQLISIVLSCLLFQHPLTVRQWGAAVVVFGALYSKSYISALRKSNHGDGIRFGSKELDKESLPVLSRIDIDANLQTNSSMNAKEFYSRH